MAISGVIRVPASSANLGPGFDTLGLALNVHLECHFRTADTLKISARGVDLRAIPLDHTNLIWKTAQRLAISQGREMPPIEMELVNGIPIGKGLGSSSAALVAGITLADQVLDLSLSRQNIIDKAAYMEGHADNVAAAVLGSFVAAMIDDQGATSVIRLGLVETVKIAVVCPDFQLPTVMMRSLLPESYSREDAVFNLQRATLMVGALATGDEDVLKKCFKDRLHQPYRLQAVPGLKSILELCAPGLLGCALSGAGPAIIVFYKEHCESVLEMVQEQFTRFGKESDIIVNELDREGLHIEST